jgi:4-amino-4-deoxy-L-arabinose transferase-like glycosyltransferase
MHTYLLKHFHPEKWFYIFITLHLIAWTLVPLLVRYNLPLDSIEGTIWGHQLEWGYDKNPYLNGWLTGLATQFGQHAEGMIYFFSQLSVIACFWAIWHLANRIIGPIYALISVFLLEGIQYFNLHSIDFNDNTLELGLWALAIYCFYLATSSTDNSSKKITRNWILVGLFTGLGTMAKYYTIALIASMILFVLTQSNVRQQLKTRAPYLGILAFLIIILPHVVWLFSHEFITVTYVFARASSIPHWTNHFFFPLQFAWQQAEVLLPTLILFSLLFLGKRNVIPNNKLSVTHFDKTFLFYLGLGPFLLTLLLSLILGITLRAGWGMPLLSLWGIILITFIQPHITKMKLYSFIAIIFIFMGILLTGYSYSLLNSATSSSSNFPGREIAAKTTTLWHDTYHTHLDYVAGSRWVGGNISFYSPDRPTVFIEWNHKRAPWVNIQKMQEKGAVFVWDITNNETLPTEIQQQFPKLEQVTVLEFNWKRNHHALRPIKIGIAMLPPDDSIKMK